MLSKSQIQLVRSLTQKKYRYKHKLFVVEGVKLVNELLNSGKTIHALFAEPGWIENNKTWEQQNRDLVTLCNKKQLKQISNLKTANEVVALVEIEEQPELTESDFILALDNIRDPGNLGTIIRTADWFGLTDIVCSPNCVDVYNSKVVQATMGSIFRVHVHYSGLAELIAMDRYTVYASLLDGENYETMLVKKPCLLIVGSESHGISADLISDKIRKITIPGKGRAESLNAAVATGLLLSKFCN